jgi:hypothetical protein
MPDLQAADEAHSPFDRLVQKAHAPLGREVLGPCAAAVDRDARFPREFVEALRPHRLFSASVPPKQGRMGLDVVRVARPCEVLAVLPQSALGLAFEGVRGTTLKDCRYRPSVHAGVAGPFAGCGNNTYFWRKPHEYNMSRTPRRID